MQCGAQKAKISEKPMGLSNCYRDVIYRAGNLSFKKMSFKMQNYKWFISHSIYCSLIVKIYEY